MSLPWSLCVTKFAEIFRINVGHFGIFAFLSMPHKITECPTLILKISANFVTHSDHGRLTKYVMRNKHPVLCLPGDCSWIFFAQLTLIAQAFLQICQQIPYVPTIQSSFRMLDTTYNIYVVNSSRRERTHVKAVDFEPPRWRQFFTAVAPLQSLAITQYSLPPLQTP